MANQTVTGNALASWGRRRPGGAIRTRTVLTLFSARDGIESHRARLILAAKGVSYDLVMVEPGREPEHCVARG